jgi:plasmid stabilization system protein ParE
VATILAVTRKLHAHPRIGRKVPETDRDDVREVVVVSHRVLYRLSRTEIHVLAAILAFDAHRGPYGARVVLADQVGAR